MNGKFFLVITLLFQPLLAKTDVHSLSLSLDPLSISENLAFYELYPESTEGKGALDRAWNLLYPESQDGSMPLTLPKFDMQAIISLITKQPIDPPVDLNSDQLAIMQRISRPLANYRLKGSTVWSEEELLALPPEEIDVARALFLYQFADDPQKQTKILQYEAGLDLMALQIRARLQGNASAEEKIRQINHFVFQEMGFRYPPLAVHIKDVDLYTLLPSVLDSRLGVCLGVCVLYICLAQRLDLPLEIITPPGHIYLRYPSSEGMINIETTARGINLPSETYLGLNTRSLQQRDIKEMIGTVFCNQASAVWRRGDYKEAVTLYLRAQHFLPEDPLVKMLLGLNYLFLGKKKEGKELLSQVHPLTFDYAVSPETIPADYLNGRVDAEGLKAIFLPIDENRTSLIQKRDELVKILKKYPKFRQGIFQLAVVQAQLGNSTDALGTFLRYHAIDPNDATIEYYLSILCFEKLDYLKAWHFWNRANQLTKERNHSPRALRDLERALRDAFPQP